jgi:hypothetical protein
MSSKIIYTYLISVLINYELQVVDHEITFKDLQEFTMRLTNAPVSIVSCKLLNAETTVIDVTEEEQ